VKVASGATEDVVDALVVVLNVVDATLVVVLNVVEVASTLVLDEVDVAFTLVVLVVVQERHCEYQSLEY
jgi:hypothetical protein